MSDHAGFRILDWDSEFFGHRIAQVDPAMLAGNAAQSIVERARDHALECLYLFLDAADTEKVLAAQTAGFRLMDVRITREIAAPAGDALALPREIDLFRPEDVPRLRAIARKSHFDSRFYHDPCFARERCDALYDEWIKQACEGASAAVVVARPAEQAEGYMTCDIPKPGHGKLGLGAIEPAQKGRGLGKRILRGAMNWLGSHGCDRIEVVTQARNLTAARMYESTGFQTTRVENVFHLWLSRATDG